VTRSSQDATIAELNCPAMFTPTIWIGTGRPVPGTAATASIRPAGASPESRRMATLPSR
jgi:hypothetical protein